MPSETTFESERLELLELFRRLALEADEFEAYSNPHAGRIAAIADQIARTFGLGARDRLSLRVAAMAHDLGEVAMSRDYIQRAGPLDPDERIDLARHPLLGERAAANSGADRGAQLLVRWHHEWWNGGGYPDGLRFEQIPLAARILRAADAYASLTDDRPYRKAYSEQQAREHLIEWAGLEFDPRVVRSLLSLEPIRELNSYAQSTSLDEAAPKVTEEMISRLRTLSAEL